MTSNVVVSIFSPVFGERGPASSRPPNAGDQRRRFGALAVRNTPDSNVEANSGAGWCLFPSEQAFIAPQPSGRHSRLGELPGVHPTRSLTRVVQENPAYDRSMNGFGAIEWLARVGFLVKGVLYVVVGVLALQVAAKAGGRVTGTRGALTTVLGQPFGRTLLLVAVVGLLGYAAWRILQGLFDPDRLGNNWRGLAIRASFVARGALHAVLGWQAFRLYRGLSAASGTSERELATEAFR